MRRCVKKSQITSKCAYEIINRKGYTNFAVALSITRIVKAILRDEKSPSPYQFTKGDYGIEDVYLSVPTIALKKEL